MLSSKTERGLYVVEIRFGDDYREQVAESESLDYKTTHAFAAKVARWLHAGKFAGLPESVIDLRGDVRAQGFDPKDADVWVTKLPRVPGGWDTRGDDVSLVLAQEPRGETEEEDTVLVVDLQAAAY